MPVQECQVDGMSGWQYGEGGKCYTYESGNEEASNEAKRLAYLQGAAITESTGEELKGLYLVAPQARMIHDRLKSTIAKAKLDDSLPGTWVLVSKENGMGIAFGEVTVGQPSQVSSTAFKDYHHSHQVSESDRMRWWQDTTPLYLYPVTNYTPYEEVIQVVVPAGTQMIMEELKEVEKVDEKEYGVADSDHPWDSDAAIMRLRRYADAEDKPNAQYRSFFMWYDPEKQNLFTGAKLPYIDIVDGTPKVIPRALSAILSRLDSTDIPDASKDEIRKRVEEYQGKVKGYTCPECGEEIEDEELSACPACGVDMERALIGQVASQVGSQVKGIEEEFEVLRSLAKEDESSEGTTVTDEEVSEAAEEVKQDDTDETPGEEPQVDSETKMSETFVLTQRVWPGSSSTAANALSRNKVAFDLFIGDKRYNLSNSPTRTSPVAFQIAEPAQIITTDNRKLDITTIPPDTQLDIKVETLYNPTNSAAQLSIIERGQVEVTGNEFLFNGRKLSGTWVIDNNTMERMEDTKVGKRVQDAKLSVLKRIVRRGKEILGMLDGEVIKPTKDFISWAEYEDETVEDAMDRAPRSILDFIAGKKACAFAFKGLDGKTYWMQWTTNAFIDREKEIFTTKALEDYVSRHESEDVKGEFWFWHIPGTKFGDVTWQGVVGRFLVEAGPFDDTPVGQAFKSFFLEHPDGHQDIAPYGWGTSHGYYYSESDREDGIYEQFEIKESTVIPWHRAANQHSPAPQIFEEVKQMSLSDKQREGLQTILGAEMTADIESQGEEMTKSLEEQGVDFKEAGEEKVTEEVPVEETPVEEVKEEVVETPVVETPVEEVKETPAYLTQDAFIEGVKLLADTLREEFSKSLSEVTASFESKVDSLQAQQEVEAEEIKEQIAETPAASLLDAMRSAIGSQSTLVSKKDAENLGAPKEAEPNAMSGMFFDGWIGK